MNSGSVEWADLVSGRIDSIPKHIEEIRKAIAKLPEANRVDLATSFQFCDSRLYSSEAIVCSYALIAEGFCSDDGFMDFRENLAFVFGSNFSSVIESPDLILERLVEPTELLSENGISGALFPNTDWAQIAQESADPAPFSCVTRANCERFAPKLCDEYLEELADTITLP